MPNRRLIVTAAAAATCSVAAWVGLPALASSRRVIASMTDGPFYPPRPWRERGPLAGDWDADLTRVARGTGRPDAPPARGEHLGLEAAVLDSDGRVVDGAEVEIWQCDALGAYHHPDVELRSGRWDEAFQGFGAARSDRAGALRFRTIKPVPYPGRTPHIHVKLRHVTFGELTSQLFVAGEAGNARDFLWRALAPADRAALEMKLEPSPAGSGLAWQVRQALVVPA